MMEKNLLLTLLSSNIKAIALFSLPYLKSSDKYVLTVVWKNNLYSCTYPSSEAMSHLSQCHSSISYYKCFTPKMFWSLYKPWVKDLNSVNGNLIQDTYHFKSCLQETWHLALHKVMHIKKHWDFSIPIATIWSNSTGKRSSLCSLRVCLPAECCLFCVYHMYKASTKFGRIYNNLFWHLVTSRWIHVSLLSLLNSCQFLDIVPFLQKLCKRMPIFQKQKAD